MVSGNIQHKHRTIHNQVHLEKRGSYERGMVIGRGEWEERGGEVRRRGGRDWEI